MHPVWKQLGVATTIRSTMATMATMAKHVPMRLIPASTEVHTMAFDNSTNRQTPPSPSPDALPEASRPSTATWKSLRDDGVQWDGQVLLTGAGAAIPAMLVLTSNRLALISGGEVALEVPRAWLRPEPKLLTGNGVRISITPQGGKAQGDATDRIMMNVREGRGASARLVGAISGRLVSSREARGETHAESPPGWGGSIGAAAPLALPPLPEFDDAALSQRAARTWPPIEQHGVPPASRSDPAATSRRGVAATSISAWTALNLPDTSATNEAAGSWGRNKIVPAPRRHARESSVPPLVIEERHQFNRGLVWGLRSLILATLIGTAAYFGRDSLPAHFDLSLPDHFDLSVPANIEQRFGLADDREDREVSQAPASDQTTTPEPTNADSDGTSGPPNSDRIGISSNDEDDGLGGQNGEITPVNPGIGAFLEPTSPPVEPTSPPVEPTEPTAPPVEPTAPPVTEVVVTAEPTQIVFVEVQTSVPVTEEPTEIPATTEPTQPPATTVPTQPLATEAPTEPPATEGPTEVPGRQDPTESVVTEEPADGPATEVPVATLESQPPSVDPGATPEQSLASGTFRFTITGASRGDTIQDLPEINAVDTGEWVVLSMYGENRGDSEQVFDMGEFQLSADGEEVLLDVGNEWVGGLLGYTPAYGNTDAILWAADEGHEFALTFLVPAAAQQLTLVAGDQAIELTSVLAEPQPLAQEASDSVQPEYIEVEVVEVLDAETIVIEQDGIEQTVRYLGLDVPTDDDCYAEDATQVNTDLVDGKTVRLERQVTDVDARGNWVRDVWAPADDGRFFLVAEELVSEGAATVEISEPNTRYEGWLLGSQSVANAEERGLWGACADEGVGASPAQPQVFASSSNRLTALRTRL